MNKLLPGRAHINPIMQMPGKMWRAYIRPKASLFDQVESLPEDVKLILALHYYEGLSFLEIGWLMELEESEAAALHTLALAKLSVPIDENGF